MTEIRKRKESDQDETQKAYSILIQAMHDHPEIEPTLWAGACLSALVNGMLESGLSYDEFCIEVEGVKNHYKQWWDGHANDSGALRKDF